MNRIKEAQKYLQKSKLDGWLLYDFRKSNELAHYFLELPSHAVVTRRFFYWIPAKGDPVKLVHAIEAHVLDELPGKKRTYLSWQSLEEELKKILKGKKRVAMEYSPKNTIPYVSRVDAGTVELVGSFGAKVVSSQDFLAFFTASLSKSQIESQIRAGNALDEIVADAWEWIAKHLKNGKKITEYDVQQKIMGDFRSRKMVTDHDPIVATNAHSADPHYEPLKGKSSEIKMGDFILIDQWAKEDDDDAIFADITRVAVAGKKPRKKEKDIFDIVRKAQVQALELVKRRFKEKREVKGYEVDDAARKVIEKAGYGKYFIHRTGHSIERSLHGSGVHMDNLEIHDVRPITVNSCFSIEPGIYLPDEFGVRLEFDVLIHANGKIQVTGGEQEEIFCLF